MPTHRDLIRDQFTKQAVPFSIAPGIRDEEALALVIEAVGAGPDDTVLDVACGPGLVVGAFARVARRAVGVDFTPAMLERARALEREQGLQNVEWVVGEAPPLPVADAAFSVVVSRFSFHHLSDPAASRFYRLRSEVEAVLSRSFPNPGDVERIRQLFVDSLADDGLGLGTHRKGVELRFAYPVAILVADRP